MPLSEAVTLFGNFSRYNLSSNLFASLTQEMEHALGYHNAQNFACIFRKHWGVSPSCYRNKYRRGMRLGVGRQ